MSAFTATAQGEYQIRVMASGRTDRGLPFTRERSLSAGVWRGGDTSPRGGPGDIGSIIDDSRRRWCAFLRCVLLTLSKNDALIKRWRELGIDPSELAKCVELLCREEANATHIVSGPATSEELRRLVEALHRAVIGQQPQ